MNHPSARPPAPFVIAPSILSANFARLGEEVARLEQAGADWVHFDVMDNHYVPNLSFGPMVCAAIRPHTTLPLDVHLMVESPDRLIGDFAAAGANIISIHPDATRHLDRSLQLITDAGCRAGLVLNPATPTGILEHVLHRLDVVLLMSVNPGFGGQSFLPSVLRKVLQVRAMLDAHAASGGKPVHLQIDGGINLQTIGAAAHAGADAFVAGSAVFGAPDADQGYRGIVQSLRERAAAGTASVRNP